MDIVSFQRFDRFREIISQNVELQTCHKALQVEGFDMDVGSDGLDNRRLFVHPYSAGMVIQALERRKMSPGYKSLRRSDVVVSQDLKPILIQCIKRLAPRSNPVVRVEPLELGPSLYSKGDMRKVFLPIDQ